MPLLLETIKIEEGKIFNLLYHQKRFDASREKLFPGIAPILLSSIINDVPKEGLYRCRIIYDENIRSVEYLPYQPKEISRVKIVASDIVYDLKYENRESFQNLLSEHSDVDEIIIEKEGYLTDTTIANLAFYDGEKWLTPEKPLLEGTMRAKLLDEKRLCKAKIRKEDLKNYTNVALINAMLGFKILKNPTLSIDTEIS